jgi:GNAT superfamily N-acetyltransferase
MTVDRLAVMGDGLFEKYFRATREAVATSLEVPVASFGDEQLTIVDRPAAATWSVAAVTFGTGTVLSIDPAYRVFAEVNQPAKHYGAMSGAFLQSIAAEGLRRGVTLNWYPVELCFTIATEPPDLAVPAGFEIREVDRAWMNAEQPNKRFGNGVGEPGLDGRDSRNTFAIVLYDSGGNPAAVAGAFNTRGMSEIGVDVLRQYRGLGVGRLVVSAMAREIIRRGDVPFYTCAPTNIRSHRTAESCGFRPVCAEAFLSGPI